MVKMKLVVSLSNYFPELPGKMDFEASNYIKKTFKCLIFIYRFGS